MKTTPAYQPAKWPARLAWLASMTLGLALLAVVWRYAIRFPMWDDFYALLDFLAATQKPLAAEAWWAEAASQHYEHRVVTGRLLAWAQFRLSGRFSPIILILSAVAMYIGAVWALLRYLQRYEGARPAGIWLVAAFCLAISAWESLSWATTALFMLLMQAGVMATAMAWFAGGRPSPLRTAVAMLGLVAVVFTGANGLALAPVLLAISAVRGQWRQRRFWLLAAVATVAIALYFSGYQRPAHQQAFGTVLLSQPGLALRYGLVLAGNVFNAGLPVAYIWGTAVVMMTAWCVVQRVWRRYPVATAIIGFGLATMAATTAGRATIGPMQATALRYISISAPVSGLLLWLTLQTLPRGWKLGWALPAAAAAMVLATGWTWRNMWPAITGAWQQHQLQKARMQQGQLSYFSYGSLFENKRLSKEWLHTYDSLGIYPFRGADEAAIMAAIPAADTSREDYPEPLILLGREGAYGTVKVQWPGAASGAAEWFVSVTTGQGPPADFTLLRPWPEEDSAGHRWFAAWLYLPDKLPGTNTLLIQATNQQQRYSYTLPIPASWDAPTPGALPSRYGN